MMLLFVFLGLVIHFVFLISIFDIYFTSPILHGITPHVSSQVPPAKRLILIVADGLRADSLFTLNQDGQTKAPYLRSVIEEKGVWGISKTQVPTESRPGHVAIIAGFYEDVSAVTRGWKENPVEFDSVFNESHYTWSWGSPDILPMFSKGASGNHVFMETYDADLEDFAGKNSTTVDTWVFQKFEDFLNLAMNNESLHKMLMEDRIVLFFHLLGLDIAGHGQKPHSLEYGVNIQVLDNGIQRLVEKIEKFYDDGHSSYIFTSDHGMTDWGSHGTGLPSETETPFIGWGAGFKKPSKENRWIYVNNDWKLGHLHQTNLSQIDLACLMSTLIGVPIPVNSRGILPFSVLENSDEFIYQSMLTNSYQIASQIKVAEYERKIKTFLYVKKFGNEDYKNNLYRLAAAKYKEKDIPSAISLLNELMILMNEELSYLHTYDRFYLKFFVSLGFFGWLSFGITVVFQTYTFFKLNSSQNYSWLWTYALGIFIAIIISLSLLVTQSSLMYYVYSLLPVIIWTHIFSNSQYYQDIWQYAKQHNLQRKIILLLLSGFLALETLVLIMFVREIVSVGLIGIAFFPFLSPLIKTHKYIVVGWFSSCFSLAIFPLVPVIGKESNYNLVAMAGWISLAIGGYCVRRRESTLMKPRKNEMKPTWNLSITLIQLLIIAVSIFIVKSTAASIANKTGLPVINQFCSWLILISSFCLPMMGPRLILPRLLNIVLSLIAPYLLLSIAHEGLFCTNLCILMFFWIKIEHMLSPQKHYKLHQLNFSEDLPIGDNCQRTLELHDIRRAYFFLYFLMTSFFGTGNIASLNSFDPSSVFCFITVFSPFVMGTLLLIKVLIPFIFVACAFQAIQVVIKVPTKALFLMVLCMSDFMALHFFFLVHDSGSWLEIGTSISHYVMMITLTIMILLLYGLAKLMTGSNLPFTAHKAHDQ